MAIVKVHAKRVIGPWWDGVALGRHIGSSRSRARLEELADRPSADAAQVLSRRSWDELRGPKGRLMPLAPYH